MLIPIGIDYESAF